MVKDINIPREFGVKWRNKFLRPSKKEFKVVIIKSYSYDIDEDVWLIKHVGGK